jgi:allophanate hydrolase subunit 2
VIVDVAPVHELPDPTRPLAVRIAPGPRPDWCVDALDALVEPTWTVQADSNRVALRLQGPPLVRAPRADGATELPPEGIVLGAVQIPPNGLPVVFGVDHPTTGGYPVVAVVVPADNAGLAQLRPGQSLRFVLGR